MTSVPTFLAGIGVGLAVAAPIGPMGVLCIQRTLAFGLMAGLSTGLAAATVTATYGFVAVLGFSPAATLLVSAGMNLLSILSAALLFWFAFRIVRRQITISAVQSGDTVQLLRSYRDALTFGFANPLTVLLFFAAFPALTSAEDLLEAPLLLAGIVAGVIGWYLSLSTVAAVLRERLSARALRYANLGSGLTLALLGGAMLAHAVGVTTSR